MLEKKYGPASRGFYESRAHISSHYIYDLALTREDMQKKTLDIAGGDSNYGSKVGDNVITMDFSAHQYHQASSLAVSGKGESMPFADESFELLLSAQGLPHMYAAGFLPKEKLEEKLKDAEDSPFAMDWVKVLNEENVEEKTRGFIQECIRVLKKGGEGKFAPVWDRFPELPHLEKFFNLLTKILEEESKQLGFTYELQNTDRSFTDDDGNETHCYRLVIKKN